MKKTCPQCSHLRKNKREKRFQERFERESGRLAARAAIVMHEARRDTFEVHTLLKLIRAAELNRSG